MIGNNFLHGIQGNFFARLQNFAVFRWISLSKWIENFLLFRGMKNKNRKATAKEKTCTKSNVQIRELHKFTRHNKWVYTVKKRPFIFHGNSSGEFFVFCSSVWAQVCVCVSSHQILYVWIQIDGNKKLLVRVIAKSPFSWGKKCRSYVVHHSPTSQRAKQVYRCNNNKIYLCIE